MGYTWTRILTTDPISPRDGTACCVHSNGRGYYAGGILHVDTNDVYSFDVTDPVGTLVREPDAPWQPAHSFNLVSHKGRVVKIGSDLISGALKPGVWSTADARDGWRLENANAPWDLGIFQNAAAIGDYIYVWGYQTVAPPLAASKFSYQCWRTADWGATVEELPTGMGWGSHGIISGPVPQLGGHSYIYGGGAYETAGWPRLSKNDVFRTLDGIATETVAERGVPWQPRIWNSNFVFDNLLWLMFGHNGAVGNTGDLSDVWRSPDGAAWTQEPNFPGTARHAASVLSCPGYVLARLGSCYGNDPGVYKLIKSLITNGAPVNASTGWAGAPMVSVDRFDAIPPGAVVSSIGWYLNGPHSGITPMIVKENAPTSLIVVWEGATVDHPGGGNFDFACGFSTPNDGGTYRKAFAHSLPTSPGEAFSSSPSRNSYLGAKPNVGDTISAGVYTDGTICTRWTAAQ